MTQTFEYTYCRATHHTSSFVEYVCYNANKNLLGVEIIKSDYRPHLYVHSGVSLNEYHDLIDSDSVGAAYNSFKMKNTHDYVLTAPQMKLVANDSDATGAAAPKVLVDNTVNADTVRFADTNGLVNLHSEPVSEVKDVSKGEGEEREFVVHFELYGRSHSAVAPANSVDEAVETVEECLEALGLVADMVKVEVYL